MSKPSLPMKVFLNQYFIENKTFLYLHAEEFFEN